MQARVTAERQEAERAQQRGIKPGVKEVPLEAIATGFQGR